MSFIPPRTVDAPDQDNKMDKLINYTRLVVKSLGKLQDDDEPLTLSDLDPDEEDI